MRSESSLSPGESLLTFTLGALLVVAVRAKQLPAVLAGSLVNPDSYERLVRLRETLRVGTPVDVVPRDQSGAGLLLHWSHLLDMLLLLLAAPLQLVMPQDAAMRLVAGAFGPLCVGALALALAWAVAPLVGRGWRWVTGLAAPMMVPVFGYGQAGVVHHHIPLAIVAAVCAGWALRVPARGGFAGWRLGLWAGVGIWLSPETMPFALASAGGIGLAWLLHPGWPPARRALAALGPGLLLVVVLAFAVDRGHGEWSAAAVDRVSWLHVGLALALCAIGAGLAGIDAAGVAPLRRGLAALLLAAVAGGAWLAAFPALLAGTDALTSSPRGDQLVREIVEMLPIRSFDEARHMLPGGLFAVAVAAWVAARDRSLLALYVALCAVGILALGVQHLRFTTYGAALGAAALPVALGRITAGVASPGLAGVSRVSCIAGLLVLPYVPDALAPDPAGATDGKIAPTCDLRDIAPLLAPAAGQVVLAELDDTPELLFRTDVLTVGSLYHHGLAGFLRADDAWSSAAGTSVPDAVRATGAAWVLACPGQADPEASRSITPGAGAARPAAGDPSLRARLKADDPPPWLERAGADAASGRVLYRIR